MREREREREREGGGRDTYVQSARAVFVYHILRLERNGISRKCFNESTIIYVVTIQKLHVNV